MTQVVLDKKKPTENARQWRRMRPNLVRTDKEFLDWDKQRNCYVVVEEETVAANVHRFLDNASVLIRFNVPGKSEPVEEFRPFNPQPKDTADIVKCITYLAHRPHGEYAPPCWLDGNDKHPDHAPGDIIAVRNGLLHVPTRTLLDKTPTFFTRTAVAIDYAADAPEPTRWLAFANEVMAGRGHLVESLQEAMGYTISGYRDMHRIFFVPGPPRAGKGISASIMQALCGLENCATPTMEQLNERYGLETSSGATLSVVTDATSSGVLVHAANNLKTVSGGDRTDVRRIGIPTVKAARIRTQFWIYFNSENYPNFGGSALAICARAEAIPFDVSFEGREDYGLFAALEPELPGILNWCLDGYARLRERGRFLETPEGEAIKSAMMQTGDTFNACLREHFEFVSGGRVEQAVASRIFTDYVKGNGAYLSPSMITRRLQKMGVTQGRPYVGPDGERRQVPVYIGLRVNDVTARTVYQWDDLLDEAVRDKGRMPIPLDMTAAEKAAAAADAARDFAAGGEDDEGDGATLH